MAKIKGFLKFSGGDRILIILCILFNAGLFFYFGSGMGQGSWVVIEVDRESRSLLSVERPNNPF
jgi:hypothetical protein